MTGSLGEARTAAPRSAASGRPVPLRVLIPLVALAGAVGALLRLLVGELLPEQGMKFPWTTLLVNLSGSAALGVLVGLSHGMRRAPAWVVPTLGTGLLASFTTFSSVILAVMPSLPVGGYAELGVVTYLSPGAFEMLAYLVMSILACTAAAAGGITVGRAIFGCTAQDCGRAGCPGGDRP